MPLILLVFCAVVAVIISIRMVLRSPILLVFAALIFFIFYVVIPALVPTASRFGDLNPTPSDFSQTGAAIPTPAPIRRALPVR